MWEILGQSSPPSFLQRKASKEHFRIRREEREAGNPFAWINSSFLRQSISSFLSDVRCWSPLTKYLRSGSLLMQREVRLSSSRPLSGNNSIVLHRPVVIKWASDFIPCKAHSVLGKMLSQSVINRDCSLRGKSLLWQQLIKLLTVFNLKLFQWDETVKPFP